MFLAFLLFLLTNHFSCEGKSISATEREAIWNNFKYGNAFVRWTMGSPNASGIIIRGDEVNSTDPVFLVEVNRHNLLTVILPLNDENTILFSSQIPTEEYPFEIILIVGQELLIATSNCNKIMHDSLADVDFRLTHPEITLGSLPHFYENIQVSSGNPLSSYCALLHKQQVPTKKERIEHRHKAHQSDGHNVTCMDEGSHYEIGYKLNRSSCEECVCTSSGHFLCEYRGCIPLLNCSYPIHEADRCCPSRCGQECEFDGISHRHGTIFWPEICVRCECNDGSVHCKLNHEHLCPTLPCPMDHQTKLEGQCCPSCVNFDYCRVNPCHEDAYCVTSNEGAKCRCKEGFFGNGTYCYDIDECRFDWSIQEQLGGCSGSICVNTKGSFRCDCLPGHPRIDERTCLNLIRI